MMQNVKHDDGCSLHGGMMYTRMLCSNDCLRAWPYSLKRRSRMKTGQNCA